MAVQEKDELLQLIDEMRLALQKADTEIKECREALKEVLIIAEPHAEFTLAYEKICNIARKGLGAES